MEDSKRCGFVSLVGPPNVGKSTLLNQIVGQKISIVTPKAQTTRSRIKGITTHLNSQIIFTDTPGIFDLKGTLNNKLNRSIVETAKNTLVGNDFVAVVLDASKKSVKEAESFVKQIKVYKERKILLLNKTDATKKEYLLEKAQYFNSLDDFERTFMISAIKGDGVKDVLNYLSENLPESPWYYSEDQVTDLSIKILASEITREKLFMNLDKELPYNVTVETEKFEENQNKIIIHQAIIVNRKSQKNIIVGKGGQNIKNIGSKSRAELAILFDKKVELYLFVKVRENWFDKKEFYDGAEIDFVK